MNDVISKMKHKSLRHIISEYAFLVPAILLIGFTAFKAYKMSFTIDESTSYMFYVRDTYANIISCSRLEANNHVLNSILMKFFSSWLPLSELTLRLPSILAHAIYLVATWLLIKDFRNLWFRLGIYLVLNLNPYLLDFFSLARGYAMSWALMVLGLYFLKLFIEAPVKKSLPIVLCFIAAAFGVLASFPLLDFYIVLLVVYLLYEFLYVKKTLTDPGQIKSFNFRVISVSLISSVLLAYVVDISYKLLRAHFLYFGGDVGFWNDTAISLILSWLYNVPYFEYYYTALRIIVIAIFILLGIYLAKTIFIKKSKPGQNSFFFILTIIFILIILGTIVQHEILGTKYLVQRTAAFILVLFLLEFVFLLSKITNTSLRLISAFAVGAISLIHFIKTNNTTKVSEWGFDSDTKKMMQDLGSYHQQQDPGCDSFIFFHPYWINATTCMFYQELFKYKWMLPVQYTNEITHTEDFYYLPSDSLGFLKGHRYKIIRKYAIANETLVENMDKAKGTNHIEKALNLYDSVSKNKNIQRFFPFANVDNVECINLVHDSYSPSINFNWRSPAPGKNVNVLASAKVFFPSIKKGVLAVAIYDKAGKILRWDSVDFGKYDLQDSGWMNIPFSLKIDKEYPQADHISIMIWNTGNKPFYASDIKADISDY